jgi:hypothetical protein
MDKGRQLRAAGGRDTDTDVLNFTSARFHNVEKSKPLAEAGAIKDGKFFAVGDTEYGMRHRTPANKIFYLHGRTVVLPLTIFITVAFCGPGRWRVLTRIAPT